MFSTYQNRGKFIDLKMLKIQIALVARNISLLPGAPDNFSTEKPADNMAFFIEVRHA